MNVMGNTITGAASGETLAAPKDSQSQAKGQKSNICYSTSNGDWETSLFF